MALDEVDRAREAPDRACLDFHIGKCKAPCVGRQSRASYDRMIQDVLLFLDNIFRYVLANAEVSALLGRMPSAVGYQPTLGTDMGELQERITSTKNGSITSIQAIYVPADDYTDP